MQGLHNILRRGGSLIRVVAAAAGLLPTSPTSNSPIGELP
jgi:hypothetical protein